MNMIYLLHSADAKDALSQKATQCFANAPGARPEVLAKQFEELRKVRDLLLTCALVIHSNHLQDYKRICEYSEQKIALAQKAQEQARTSPNQLHLTYISRVVL